MKLFASTHHSDSLEKVGDVLRAENICTIFANYSAQSLVKTASVKNEAVNLLVEALSNMNLKVNIDLGELLKKIQSSGGGLEKLAETTKQHREEQIKIASKEIKDSHYQIDITQDSVHKQDRQLHMVSFYMRDAYLGRYLIKRNFFFADNNKKEADEVFEEMIRKGEKIKHRYLDDKIAINSIFAETKAYLDSVRGDITESTAVT